MIDKDNLVPESKAHEDAQIIRDILGGQKDSFSLLLLKYKEKIRNLVYFVTNDKSCVDDLTQDIFLKVYESLRYFQFKSSFYTWLYRITVNRCRDEIRKKRLKKMFPFDKHIDLQNDNNMTPDVYQKIDNEMLVNEALGKLKYDHKEILVLKELNGLSYQEISEILNCEIGTVKSRLSRARLEFARLVTKMSGKKYV